MAFLDCPYSVNSLWVQCSPTPTARAHLSLMKGHYPSSVCFNYLSHERTYLTSELGWIRHPDCSGYLPIASWLVLSQSRAVWLLNKWDAFEFGMCFLEGPTPNIMHVLHMLLKLITAFLCPWPRVITKVWNRDAMQLTKLFDYLQLFLWYWGIRWLKHARWSVGYLSGLIYLLLHWSRGGCGPPYDRLIETIVARIAFLCQTRVFVRWC